MKPFIDLSRALRSVIGNADATSTRIPCVLGIRSPLGNSGLIVIMEVLGRYDVDEILRAGRLPPGRYTTRTVYVRYADEPRN